MRREIFRSERERALALLRRAPTVHLATTTPEGAPVLRALDAAVLGDGVYFHGARTGEKARCLGRPAVVSAEELVAHVPSWMVDPRWACPASTLYRSVQAHGALEEVTEPSTKARALSALMERWQPEGRYEPIAADHPYYRGQLEGTLVLRVGLDQVDGKEKLLQNRKPEEIVQVLAGLWQRGQPGDVAAIEAIREANPGAPTPPFLDVEGGLRLALVPSGDDLARAEALLAGEQGWTGCARALIQPAQRSATAWVGACDPEGRLVACARALADAREAWIHDLVVERPWRGRGLGSRLLRLLLDHPAVRAVPEVRLRTREPQGLYARLGFESASGPARAGGESELVLARAASPLQAATHPAG